MNSAVILGIALAVIVAVALIQLIVEVQDAKRRIVRLQHRNHELAMRLNHVTEDLEDSIMLRSLALLDAKHRHPAAQLRVINGGAE